MRIADGSTSWSSLGLPAFGSGTAGLEADGPIYAHKYEKIIDPTSSQILSRYGIKVSGSGDSKEEIRELKQEIVNLKTSLAKILASGFTALVEGQKESNKSLKTVESGNILAKRAVNQ